MNPAAKPSLAGIGLSALTCALAAFVLTSLGEGLGSLPLPAFLESSMSLAPGLFRTHILACCIGVVSGAAAFADARSGRPHRGIGRVALALLMVGAATSLPVAWAGSSSPAAKAAFLGQGATLAGAIAVGWRAGRRGPIALHRGCMACAALALSGVPLSRIALKLPLPWSTREAAYATVAWFSWLAPFAAASCIGLARRHMKRVRLAAEAG